MYLSLSCPPLHQHLLGVISGLVYIRLFLSLARNQHASVLFLELGREEMNANSILYQLTIVLYTMSLNALTVHANVHTAS